MSDPIQPLNPLQEGDLLAYLDGDASHEVVLAIEQDAALQAQVEELRQAELLFGLSLAQRDCPDTDSLLEYQVDLLEGKAYTAIAAHLVTCRYCQAEMRDLAAGIAWEEVEAATPAPAPKLNWRDALREVGRRLLELTLLPQAQQPMYALRGESRQLVFSAESFQVIISINQQPDQQFKLEGQLINLADPLAMPSGLVTFRTDSTDPINTLLDEFGHFELEVEKADSGELQIDVNETTSLVTIIVFDS